MFTLAQYEESAAYIRAKSGGFEPRVLMILGSGLGFMGELVERPIYIDYGEIPHFRPSTAPGHRGRFVLGELGGVPVMVMQGRMHCYEGYTAWEAAYPVRVARLLGAHSMIVTNACGAVNTDYAVGELMLITDHIKFFDPTPLQGPNVEAFGPRFCDMTYTYSADYRKIALEKAGALGLTLRSGVYCYFPGPQFETPAEIRAVRVLGADAVGMSTVPEAIAANHCGMKILGISLVTNMAAGVLDMSLSGVDVLAAAEKAKAGFSGLILACLPHLGG